MVHPEPYGVALVMGAWNYPINLALTPAVGAIAAGNCVVIKPSEISEACASLIASLIPRYLDPECIKVLSTAIGRKMMILNPLL